MKKGAGIFDMDGVISNTQQYHGQVEVEIFHHYEIHTTHPDSKQQITQERIGQNFSGVQPGIRMKNIFENHDKGNEFDIEAIEHTKGDLLLNEHYKKGVPIKFIPGAKELIHNLSASGDYHLAVVTASTKACAEFVLNTLNISHKFDDTVSIYDIDPHTGKPYTSKGDPEIYQRLTEKYKIGNRFVMIEDGSTGMMGAIKAGGKPIAILGDNPKEKFPQAHDRHKDLSTITVETIQRIIDTTG